jgi:hypothetical protein
MRTHTFFGRIDMKKTFFGGAALLTLATAACDTTVTNPGPVQDDFLADRNAASAMVNGAGRALSSGMNWISYTGAAVAREIHPAGSTGSFGISARWQNGELNGDDADLNRTGSRRSARAGWRRKRCGGSRPQDRRRRQPPDAGAIRQRAQQAYVYAGLRQSRARREHVRSGIDGSGAASERDVLHARREPVHEGAGRDWRYAATVSRSRSASYAGRAAARVFLGKWTEAVTDAGRWRSAFVYNMPYFNIGNDDQRNRIFWASAIRARAALPIERTRSGTPGTTTTACDQRPARPDHRHDLQGDAAIECCGKVSWYPEAKHASSAARSDWPVAARCA